jgi:hypothetical protein
LKISSNDGGKSRRLFYVLPGWSHYWCGRIAGVGLGRIKPNWPYLLTYWILVPASWAFYPYLHTAGMICVVCVQRYCQMQPREIFVHVTPGARSARIVVRQDPDRGEIIGVYVTARAHNGKANQAVIKALAEHFAIPPSYFRIKRGILCRDKTILVHQS